MQAPGEAEAELAYLNRLGAIDAVITDDIDCLAFGATYVLHKYVACLFYLTSVSFI